jgi:Methyltransferase domain
MAQSSLRALALVTDAFGGTGGIAPYNRHFLSSLATCEQVGEVIEAPIRTRRSTVSIRSSRVDWAYHLASEKVKLVRELSTEVGRKVPEEVDYVFIDGDHSLRGSTADWTFWSERVGQGGIIALHDTILPIDKTEQSELGSHKYFRSEIQQDPRFEIVGQQDSLSVLKKR